MKVFAGLSGGVDSSVAAALLVEQGFDVVGVYMKNWSKDVAGHKCPWKEDLASARSVAAHLKIPLKVYDFEKQYFEAVTSYMVDAYKKGITPNPDVMCNQEIKFKVFLEQCLVEGADAIATGHYAVMEDGVMKVAADSNKDQTYFLYRMNPKVATKVILPLGKYKKPEVRKLAKKHNLPTASRADSMGLCFVGNVPMKDFLGEFIKAEKGEIIDDVGNHVGFHEGSFAYTIGQRHGLNIGGGKPYFVYKIDTKNNKVYVTTEDNSDLLNKDSFEIADCVWWQKPTNKLKVKVRYRSESVECKVKQIDEEKYLVNLNDKERAITPGQSAVFYSVDVVVGGGIIL